MHGGGEGHQGMIMRHLALSLMMACALAACGGGGGGDASQEPVSAASAEAVAPAASVATDATISNASSGSTGQPVANNGGGSSASAGSSPGATALGGTTYVGHWLGYQIVATPTQYHDYLNGGGVLLKFSSESYGKLQAEGAMDAVAHWSGVGEPVSARLGVGFVGDLYSDQNVYGWGTGSHLLAAMVSGRFDPASKRLTLTSAQAGGNMGSSCKYCDGDYFTGTRNQIQVSPVGASNPASFKLALSGKSLTWPAATGVQHWMVSIFEEGASWGRTEQVYTPTLPFASTQPSPINGPDGRPTVYSIDEYLNMMLLKGATLNQPLPSMVKGSRYVATITGFGIQPPDVVPTAVAWSSLRFSAP